MWAGRAGSLLWAAALASAVTAARGAPGAPPAAPDTLNASDTSSNPIERSAGLVRDAVQRGCAAKYTVTCLKLDALSFLGRMAVPTSYDLLPGVSIRRQADPDPEAQQADLDLPAHLVRSMATDQPSQVDQRLDEYLMARFGNFLDSHSIQVHLLDLQPVANLRKSLSGTTEATGRRKNNGLWQQLMGAGMMMGGSTLTMGLSALAAMAGKALLLSMLSLVLSALSGMNGGGGGGGGHSQKQTTYEIISKPIYTHGHSHSAELHHEPTGPAAPYLYGRAKDTADQGGLSGTLSSTSGVGGSALGGISGLGGQASQGTYITQFPRSLQESAQTATIKTKGSDDKSSDGSGQRAGSSSVAASNFDNLLIRNLHYVKGEDGRAKYVTTHTDLVPSETDYSGDEQAAQTAASPKKYVVVHDDPAARSFQVSSEGGSVGVLVGPRSMHTLARLPRPVVESPRQSTESPWEAITTTPPSTSTSRSQLNPAFVVARAVVPAAYSAPAAPTAPVTPSDTSLLAATPRTVAYRAYT